jgi:isoleucyl-tRNA synthetase
LHIGHALNKLLKDIINKFETLRGKRVTYIPGWDCHGLPIELKVLQSIKPAERSTISPIELRRRAAEFATQSIDNQRSSFKRFGVWGEWDAPYTTMQPAYEAAQVKVFGEMFKKGCIYRGRRPVHWSPSSRTALAEAELEYPEGHASRAAYVGFRVAAPTQQMLDFAKLSGISENNIDLGIWTTTPWTLVANLAVAVNADIEYSFVTGFDSTGSYMVVAKELVPSFAKTLGLEPEALKIASYIDPSGKTVDSLRGLDLDGCTYVHPLTESLSPSMKRSEYRVVIGGDYITTASGTGLVHTAPGHGLDDFAVGVRCGLGVVSPVDDAGRYTAEAGPQLVGKSVLTEGTDIVIDLISRNGAFLKDHMYTHKYPYDWRTKKPTIMRVTDQWFAGVASFQGETQRAIDSVDWIPSSGRNRISKMTETRGDWCISRQRVWGVPIPVFFHKDSGEVLMNDETIAYIADVFSEEGSDAWWSREVRDLLPPGPLRERADEYVKGADTMDVWFDSGTSWAGVMEARAGGKLPADMYLEGSDQHRGWFQSSLLTSVATRGVPPYKSVLTHGFVLDEKGEKMSKSLNNVVDPMDIVLGVSSNLKAHPAYGADVLRMWVASVDYTSDVCVGGNIIKQISESNRKLRNTFRYILSNLADFNPLIDAVEYQKLPAFDKFMLGRATQVFKQIEKSYESFQFFQVYTNLLQFVIRDLSNFYFDASKDRLYVSRADDYQRRSCQTVLWHVLEHLSCVVAPLAPHLAEDVWMHLPYAKPTMSVFQNGWLQEKHSFDSSNETIWSKVALIRDDLNKCIELARKDKAVGASQECQVFINAKDDALQNFLKLYNGDMRLLPSSGSRNLVDDLRFILIVSQVHICDNEAAVSAECPAYFIPASASGSGAAVGVKRAAGQRCERCWYYCPDVSVRKFASHEGTLCNDLCGRCAHALGFKEVS